MNQSQLRRFIKRGVVVAGLGLGLAAGVLVQANAVTANAGWSVSHKLVPSVSTTSDVSTVTTLDASWW